MFTNVLSLRKGDTLTCKYPKHGRRNILKRHSGEVEHVGVGKGGLYATIRSNSGAVRSLSFTKMIDPTIA
ncbi:MAG: hypothetical protein CMH30_00835 [Micavibrio sp.]|nr:hypothetical protein [Micavibrio sp.]